MNQAILFSERIEYNEAVNQISFFAQVNGLLVRCRYTVSENNAEQAIKQFELKRFDYEELAELEIENENFNEFGEIELEEL